jgi:hypothetical protein
MRSPSETNLSDTDVVAVYLLRTNSQAFVKQFPESERDSRVVSRQSETSGLRSARQIKSVPLLTVQLSSVLCGSHSFDTRRISERQRRGRI